MIDWPTDLTDYIYSSETLEISLDDLKNRLIDESKEKKVVN